jgi:copper chaperone NosL
MNDIFEGLTTKLDKHLKFSSRVLVFLAALALIPTFVIPLWHMTFIAQQYPEGLDLYVYSHDLVGGNKGNDLTEINVLNHYIGMAELRPTDFSELKWIPLVIGLIGVLTLRAATIGNVRAVVDVIVISLYFGGFSMWTFWYKMQYYGANLDPRASVQVEPFMPPIFGYKQVGQFDVWSYPALGSYLFLAFGVLLVGAVLLSWRNPAQGKSGSGDKR